MTLDPAAKSHLEAMQGLPAITSFTPIQARQAFNARRALVDRPIEPVGSVRDETVASEDGPIDVRVYTPDHRTSQSALVYLHGGGWVVGNLDGVDGVCRQFTNRLGISVISVDYRLSPEHKFPAAPRDACAVFRWAVEHATAFGAQPTRIGIGGDSSGGNIAAGAALMLRDANDARAAFQLLIYPVTYADLDPTRYDTQYDMPLLSGESMAWYSTQYLPDPSFMSDGYASPLACKDLSHLPPTVLVCAGVDVLRAQVEAYRERLVEAGVEVDYLLYDDLFHGFLGMSGVLERSTVAMNEICAAVAKLL